MIVSHPARVLFVHVQKCGGSTVESLLLHRLPGAEKVYGLPGNRHAHLSTVLARQPELAGYWTFGFVRNPWARMWSWHAMILRRGAAADAGNQAMATEIGRNPFWAGVLRHHRDFESFVLHGPDRFPRLGTPQLDYLRTSTRRADLIGRTETLEGDLGRVFGELGLEPPPAAPRVNAGPPQDYRAHYTDRTRDRVGELFAPDLEEFGYRF